MKRKTRRTGTAAADAGNGSEANPGAQSLTRAIGLLKLVAQRPRAGMSLAEVAQASGLHRATAHRLLRALVAERLLAQDRSRRFYPGSELWLMGRAAEERFNLVELAQPCIERIARETGDAALVCTRSGDEAVYLARCEGDFPIKALTLNVGDRRPLGVSSGSLAILSFLEEAERKRILASLPRQLKDFPDFSPALIARLIAQTRRNRYALNPVAHQRGSEALGVPVLDGSDRPIAAFTVTAISARMTRQRIKELVQLMEREARILAAAMGGGGVEPA
ncbi:MAG: IclR family transcriptional regulator [Reyranellaceae bacterium]